MKRFFVLICAVTLVLGVVPTVDALPITDITTFNSTGTNPAEDYVSHGQGTVNKLDGALDYVKWTHHFDFDPPAEEVLSGTITISLRDDGDWWGEFAFGWTEGGSWDLGEVDTGDYSYSVGASYLADGTFTVTLASVLGDFYIDQSALEISYNPIASIPDVTTLALLGTAAMIGAAVFGRKEGEGV